MVSKETTPQNSTHQLPRYKTNPYSMKTYQKNLDEMPSNHLESMKTKETTKTRSKRVKFMPTNNEDFEDLQR